MTYRLGPDLLEIPDEPDGPYCEVCGAELEWEACDQCGGEGGRDGDELMEEDPLWYRPDDYERCEHCDGRGGWLYCWNTNAPEHVAQRLEEERKER